MRRTWASRVVVSVVGALLVGGVTAAPVQAAQTVERASVADPSTGNTQANGQSVEVSVSADGRYVAFASSASNLVSGDTNNAADIFVRDRQAGTTQRVSLPDPVTMPGQTQANGASSWTGLSDDGCRVAFTSYAANLTPGDNNGVRDVYVRDRCTSRTYRASVPATSNPFCISGESPLASISGDGRYVGFASFAANLVGSCTGWFVSHIYVRDLQTNTTELVDKSAGGGISNSWSWGADLSVDGRYVVFSSLGSNIVPGDGNGRTDAFVRDRVANTVERVSVTSAGGEPNGDSVASFSGKSRVITPDGRYVAFRSAGSNVVVADTNNTWDIFLRDRQAASTERVSLTGTGAQANGQSQVGQISQDGRYVSFQSQATNFDARDGDAEWDVYLKDRVTGEADLVSVNSAGQSTNSWIDDPVLSPTGRFLAWADYGDNMVPGDTNGVADVVFVDRQGTPPPNYPDLGVSKTHSATFQVNEQASYTIRVRNHGAVNAAGPISLSDALPAGLTLVSAAGTGWTCVATACTYAGTIAAGDQAPDVTLTVAVGAAAVPSVTNTAAVSCTCGDLNPANDTAADVTTVIPADSVAIAIVGGPVYTLTERGITSGDISVVKNANGTIRQVSGTATTNGATGGTATVTFNVGQFLNVYNGTVTVDDPNAGIHNVQAGLLFTPVTPLANPNGATASHASLYTVVWPWTTYYITWTVRDYG